MGAPIYGSSVLSVRPVHDVYRSMPGTPVGIDPRGPGAMDLTSAMSQSRLGFDVGDYFSANSRLAVGTLRPRSPLPGDYEHEGSFPRSRAYGLEQESWREEIIRRYGFPAERRRFKEIDLTLN